jgi:hypothetical protein
VSVLNAKSTRISAAGALIAALSCGLYGCGPEGQGTIKVSPKARSSIEPQPAEGKVLSGKQAKVKEIEDEAKAKDPKRF